MGLNLQLKPGTWLVANCGDYPSENDCKLAMLGPADQKADLVEAAIAHAVKNHGHTDSPELRAQLDQMFKTVEVAPEPVAAG